MTPRQAHSPSLRLQNIAVVRGNRLVIDNLSLQADAGDIIWIRGANGSGKSTLLRLIAGLLPNLSGEMRFEGTLGFADENLALDSDQTVRQALRFWAGLDSAPAASRNAAMAAMDLQGLADIPVRLLSTGQRKRANLARVIASGAAIWLLDEPYNGLDSASAARLDEALFRHSASGGIALVAAHQAPSINVAQSITIDIKAAAA